MTTGASRIIELPQIRDPRGKLTFIQNGDHLPFSIKSVRWLYDIPGGQSREGHAHRSQHEVIVALSGSVDVVIWAEGGEERVTLNRAHAALYLPPLTWRCMDDFSTNALALHLLSGPVRESDCISNPHDLQELRKRAR